MKSVYLQQIERIIEGLDFQDNRLSVKQGKMVYELPIEEQTALIQGLTNIIYSEFYCEGTVQAVDQLLQQTTLDQDKWSADSDDFTRTLRQANRSQERLDRGWQVERNLPDGSVYARKGHYRDIMAPGAYLRALPPSSDGQSAGEVMVYRRPSYQAPQDQFYYIYGTAVGESTVPGLARLYFNLKPSGALLLVEQLSTAFNDYQIPFQFKCLNRVAYYQRSDSAVLYINQCYLSFALEVFQSFYADLKSHLRPGVPLFALEVAPGIAFAEEPPVENESFGMSRSRMIAEGIWQAMQQQLPKSGWRQSILNVFKSYRLDVEQPYLNPDSHYPIHFPNFN